MNKYFAKTGAAAVLAISLACGSSLVAATQQGNSQNGYSSWTQKNDKPSWSNQNNNQSDRSSWSNQNGSQQNGNQNDRSSWFKQNGKSSTHGTEIPETEMLNNLDKEGRTLYNSLDSQGKRLARELAAQSVKRGDFGAKKDFRSAVDAAKEQMSDQQMKIQDRRLHNGMDRTNEKQQTPVNEKQNVQNPYR